MEKMGGAIETIGKSAVFEFFVRSDPVRFWLDCGVMFRLLKLPFKLITIYLLIYRYIGHEPCMRKEENILTH